MIYPAKLIQKSGLCAPHFPNLHDETTNVAFATLTVPGSIDAYENDFSKNVAFVDEVTLFKNVVYRKDNGRKNTIRLGFSPYFGQLISSLLRVAKEELNDEGCDVAEIYDPFKEQLIAFVKVSENMERIIEKLAGDNEKLEAFIRPTIYYNTTTYALGCSLGLVRIRPITAELQKVFRIAKAPKPPAINTNVQTGGRGRKQPLKETKRTNRQTIFAVSEPSVEELMMYGEGEE